MPTADYSSYHQPSGTVADGTKFDNLIDAVQATVNGLDNNNFAAGKIFDNTKIMQGGAALGNLLQWNGASWVPYSPQRARVTRAFTQSIANNTDTNVLFDTETYDTDTMHDLVTATDRVTVKTAGVYLVTFNSDWAAGTSTGVRQARIFLNDITEIGGDSKAATATVTPKHSLSVVWDAAVNDFFTAHVFHTEGVALNLGSGRIPTLTVARIA